MTLFLYLKCCLFAVRSSSVHTSKLWRESFNCLHANVSPDTLLEHNQIQVALAFKRQETAETARPYQEQQALTSWLRM